MKPEDATIILRMIVKDTGVRTTEGKPVRRLDIDYWELPDGRCYRMKKNEETGKAERVFFVP